MATLAPTSAADLDLLRAGTLSHKTSEILCRLAVFSYLKTGDEITTALGNEWNGLETRLDDSDNNQWFAAWADGVAVVSFRGTDAPSDWAQNARVFFPDRHDLGGRRHDGFQDVWQQGEDAVRDVLGNRISEGCQLWMTGHSLGGAVATAAAAAFLLEQPAKIKPAFNVTTFGAPRFGNRQFQSVYDAKMLNRHWFYANKRDPIPHLAAAWMGYRHGGSLKYFDDTGDFLDVAKEQVGLQAGGDSPEDRASQHWLLLDEDINVQSRTQSELDEFINQLASATETPAPTVTGDGVAIDETGGELQGDNLWTTSAHKLALYWERINAIA